MFIHYSNNQAILLWQIFRGASHVLENFSRSRLAVMAQSHADRFPLDYTVIDNGLRISLPQGLPEGLYALDAVWTKNEGRDFCRARVDHAFAVTDEAVDATGHGALPEDCACTLRSHAATYGYDGLSAYELALLKGMTSKTETEWLQAAVDNAEAEEQRRTAETLRTDTFHQLTARMQTAIGQNVKSIEQTATSNISGGENVITITQNDDTQSTFVVRNGIQGATGAQGPQGESGVSLGEVAIADNLITDDATKVLSAKQGCVLKGLVDETTENVQTIDAAVNRKFKVLTGRWIGTSGYYNYNFTGYKSILVPYFGGNIKVSGITLYNGKVLYYSSDDFTMSSAPGYVGTAVNGTILSGMTTVKFALYSFADTENINNIVVEQDGYLVTEKEIEPLLGKKKILCIGDSLTGRSYGGWVKGIGDQIGDDFQMIPIGVPGEHVYTTAARCGGVSAFVTTAVTLPADTSSVAIGTQLSDGTHEVKPVNINEFYNPVRVNGVECLLTLTDGTYRLERMEVGTSQMVINTDEPLVFNTTHDYINKDKHAVIIWIGTNSSELSYDATEITHAIDRIIASFGTHRYIVMGVHRNAFTLPKLEALEAMETQKYGSHYINWRRYAIEHGFEVTGLTPTQTDLDAMADGFLPPAFLNEDGLHLNNYGNQIVTKVIIDRMNALGWIT